MATYSHSRLKTFEQCPRSFLWRYVWGVRPVVEGVEAFVGKRVHECLEDLYERVARGQEPPPLRELLDRYGERWRRAWSGSVRIVRDRSMSHYFRLGVDCLEGYYRLHHPFQGGTTLAVEQSFRLDLNGAHQLRGIIDRVDLGPEGTLEVHDYKTGRRTASVRELQADQQVGFYEIAVRHLYPQHRRVRFVWHYLQARTVRRVESRSPEALVALRRETVARIEDIEGTVRGYTSSLEASAARALLGTARSTPSSVPVAARVPTRAFPARTGVLCRWCSFLDWCQEGSEHCDVPFRPPEPVRSPELPPPSLATARRGEQGRLF